MHFRTSAGQRGSPEKTPLSPSLFLRRNERNAAEWGKRLGPSNEWKTPSNLYRCVCVCVCVCVRVYSLEKEDARGQAAAARAYARPKHEERRE